MLVVLLAWGNTHFESCTRSELVAALALLLLLVLF